MSFQWPYALLALPFVLAGLLVLFTGSRRARERLLGNFAAARLLPLLLISYSPALRFIKHTLIAVGALLAVFALARPQWGYDWQENHTRGVDVVFVIDTSRSMLTPDVQPNRLERAKLAIYDCVEKMAGNRVGLVAFAGDAFLQCPLTLDYDAFRQTLESVDTNTIARGGTDIAVGLDAAATALEKSGSNKIIVLLTDGEDLEGQGVAEAKTLADQGITIYTVGVGTTDGELIPIVDESGHTGFVRDQRGELVKSHLDATTLSDIANATHGFYQPLGATGEGLQRVYENGIKKAPEQNLQAQMRRQPIERFQWPLAAGTLLLALEMLLGTRRPTWLRSTMPILNLLEPLSVTDQPANKQKAAATAKAPSVLASMLLLLLAGMGIPRAQAADTPAESADTSSPAKPTSTIASSSPKVAQSLFEKGDFQAAANAYANAAETTPGDGRLRYNQGESLYRSQDFESAAQAYVKSLSSSDLPLQQRAYYNLGNAHYRLGQTQMQEDKEKAVSTWEAAVKDYQNALDLNPADTNARYNRDLVKKQVDELKKQLEQQKQQQNQSKDQQDQQNQQNQPQNSQNQQNQNKDQQQQQQNQSQSSQQNQSSSPNNQNSQNQSKGQQDQNKSQQDQQNQQDQSQNSQNQQNQDQQQPSQSSSQNQSGQQSQDQSQPQNQQNGGQSPNQKNSSGQQNQPDSQKSPNGGQKQPQNSQGQSGQQPQSKPGDNGNKQPQNGKQPQPAPASGTNSNKEPDAQKKGQQTSGATPASGQPSSTSSGDTAGASTVVLGVMTREEAQQLLNSLKPNERKLPASRLQPPSQQSSADQTYKDW